MHLLRVEEGGALYDSDQAVDLGQPPGDIVILTSADTEVSLLSAAVAGWQAEGDVPEVRITNYLSLLLRAKAWAQYGYIISMHGALSTSKHHSFTDRFNNHAWIPLLGTLMRLPRLCI